MIWYASLLPLLNLGSVYSIWTYPHILRTCQRGYKTPVYTLCSFLKSSLQCPGWFGQFGSSLLGACEPWPHSCALRLKLVSCQSPLLSAAGAGHPCTSTALGSARTCPMHCREPCWPPLQKVTKTSECVQKPLLQKYTTSFCCHCFLNKCCQSPTTKKLIHWGAGKTSSN